MAATLSGMNINDARKLVEMFDKFESIKNADTDKERYTDSHAYKDWHNNPHTLELISDILVHKSANEDKRTIAAGLGNPESMIYYEGYVTGLSLILSIAVQQTVDLTVNKKQAKA